MDLKLRYLFIAILAGALLAFAIVYFFPTSAKTITQIREKIVRDTTTVYVAKPPRIITRWKSQIEYVRDTVIQTKPFVATADTVTDGDTLHVEFSFPENRFEFTETRKPDTVKVIKNYIVDEPEPKPEEPWYQHWIYVGAGTLGGLILGLILGK